MFFTIIIFIITLLILVVIHEFGHFIVAKKFNIKVLEFGFGIPPKAWGKQFGETLVSINWLPIGGFVRLLGEDEVDKKVLENHRSFAAAKVWKRMLVVVAGVTMNFLLAWALYYIVLGTQGFKVQLQLITPHQFVGAAQSTEAVIFIGNVANGSPAEQTGIKPGERIVSINGLMLQDTSDLISQAKMRAGQEVQLQVSDPKKEHLRTVTIIPRKDPPAGEGPLGISLSQVDISTLEYKTPLQKLFSGPVHSWNVVSYTGNVLGQLVQKSFKEKTIEPVSGSLAGPVGITSLVSQILSIKNPVIPYLDFVALLSLNLAVFNLLPFPALDGGRLFFLVIEAITRRRVHVEFEKWVHTIGMVILLTLALLVTLSDIRKIWF